MIDFNEYLEQKMLNNEIEYAATLVVETGFPIEEFVERCAYEDPNAVLNEFLGTAAALGAGALAGRYIPKAWKWFKGKFGSAGAKFEDAKQDAIKALQLLQANVDKGSNREYMSIMSSLIRQLSDMKSQEAHQQPVKPEAGIVPQGQGLPGVKLPGTAAAPAAGN